MTVGVWIRMRLMRPLQPTSHPSKCLDQRQAAFGRPPLNGFVLFDCHGPPSIEKIMSYRWTHFHGEHIWTHPVCQGIHLRHHEEQTASIYPASSQQPPLLGPCWNLRSFASSVYRPDWPAPLVGLERAGLTYGAIILNHLLQP